MWERSPALSLQFESSFRTDLQFDLLARVKLQFNKNQIRKWVSSCGSLCWLLFRSTFVWVIWHCFMSARTFWLYITDSSIESIRWNLISHFFPLLFQSIATNLWRRCGNNCHIWGRKWGVRIVFEKFGRSILQNSLAHPGGQEFAEIFQSLRWPRIESFPKSSAEHPTAHENQIRRMPNDPHGRTEARHPGAE